MEPELDGKVPSFIDAKVTEEVHYPGAPDAVPTFDHEIALLPEGDQRPTAYAGRWALIARLHILGYMNTEIAAEVGYTPVGVGLVLRNSWVQAECARLRNMCDADVMGEIKEGAVDSIRYLRTSIKDAMIKPEIRSANARWFVEKQTGKPKQEMHVEHGGLVAFMDIAKEMQRRGEPLDVTPSPLALEQNQPPEPHEVDRWDTWLDSNF